MRDDRTTHGEFEITLVAPADFAVVADLLVRQMHEHRIDRQPDEMREVVRRVQEHPDWGFILAAKVSGRVAGVAYVAAILSAEHGGMAGYLEELYVIPEERQRGIGQGLLRAAIDRTKELGWKALELEVDIEHERAVALYKRFGFTELPRSRWLLMM